MHTTVGCSTLLYSSFQKVQDNGQSDEEAGYAIESRLVPLAVKDFSSMLQEKYTARTATRRRGEIFPMWPKLLLEPPFPALPAGDKHSQNKEQEPSNS